MKPLPTTRRPMTFLFTACILTALMATAPALAADRQEDRSQAPFLSLLLHHVEPGNTTAYRAAMVQFVELLDTYDWEYPFAATSRLNNEQFGYAFPLMSIGEMDDIGAAIRKWDPKLGPAWSKVMEQVDSTSNSILRRRADLSYAPPGGAPPQTEFGLVQYSRLVPSALPRAESLLEEFRALATKKGLTGSYTAFQAVVGDDAPYMVFGSSLADPGDQYESGQEFAKQLGSEGAKLFERWRSLLRSEQSFVIRAEPELSYAPQD